MTWTWVKRKGKIVLRLSTVPSKAIRRAKNRLAKRQRELRLKFLSREGEANNNADTT